MSLIKFLNTRSTMLFVFFMSFFVQAVHASTFNTDKVVSSNNNLDTINDSITAYSTTTFTMIKTVGVLVGLVMVFAGVMRLKKSQDQNSGVSPMQGIMLIVIGGMLAVLPWILLTTAGTVSTE